MCTMACSVQCSVDSEASVEQLLEQSKILTAKHQTSMNLPRKKYSHLKWRTNDNLNSSWKSLREIEARAHLAAGPSTIALVECKTRQTNQASTLSQCLFNPNSNLSITSKRTRSKIRMPGRVSRVCIQRVCLVNLHLDEGQRRLPSWWSWPQMISIMATKET